MIRRRTIAMAVATTLLGGLGTYGATTAFAASPADPKPAPSVTVSTTAGPAAGIDAMIRHCTDQLPAGQRGAAEKTMREMMANHGAGSSMMGGPAADSMMGGRSGGSMTGMMGGTGS